MASKKKSGKKAEASPQRLITVSSDEDVLTYRGDVSMRVEHGGTLGVFDTDHIGPVALFSARGWNKATDEPMEAGEEDDSLDGHEGEAQH